MKEQIAWIVNLLKIARTFEKTDQPKIDFLKITKRLQEEKGLLIVQQPKFEDVAFYQPSKDLIVLGKFDGGNLFALIHEICHWTGGEKRLSRPEITYTACEDADGKTMFYDPRTNMKEELTANIGTLLICHKIKLRCAQNFISGMHAAYISATAQRDPVKTMLLSQKHAQEKIQGVKALLHVLTHLKGNSLLDAIEQSKQVYQYLMQEQFEQ